MTPAPEQLAAIERLRKWQGWHIAINTSDMIQDAWAVAQLCITEHASDDGELVTEEWLRASGFKPAWGHPFQLGGSDIDIRCTPDELVLAHRSDEWNVRDQPTRGDVRKLCDALDVPLHPQQETTQ